MIYTTVKRGRIHMLVNTPQGVRAACGQHWKEEGTENPKRVTCKNCMFAVDIVKDARWGGTKNMTLKRNRK